MTTFINVMAALAVIVIFVCVAIVLIALTARFANWITRDLPKGKRKKNGSADLFQQPPGEAFRNRHDDH